MVRIFFFGYFGCKADGCTVLNFYCGPMSSQDRFVAACLADGFVSLSREYLYEIEPSRLLSVERVIPLDRENKEEDLENETKAGS